MRIRGSQGRGAATSPQRRLRVVLKTTGSSMMTLFPAFRCGIREPRIPKKGGGNA